MYYRSRNCSNKMVSIVQKTCGDWEFEAKTENAKFHFDYGNLQVTYVVT